MNRKYEQATREKLVELLELIEYKVTTQSSGDVWKLIRLPNGISTDHWILPDRIEHKLDDNRGGTTFFFSDCTLSLVDDTTVAIIAKNSPNSSIFIQFHNFRAHRKEQS